MTCIVNLETPLSWSDINNNINLFCWYMDNLIRAKIYKYDNKVFLFLDIHSVVCGFYVTQIVVRDFLMILDGKQPVSEKKSIFALISFKIVIGVLGKVENLLPLDQTRQYLFQ